MAGLKPAYGGSIPPFLGRVVELVRMLVLQKCGKVVDIREVILHLLWLVRLIQLHV